MCYVSVCSFSSAATDLQHVYYFNFPDRRLKLNIVVLRGGNWRARSCWHCSNRTHDGGVSVEVSSGLPARAARFGVVSDCQLARWGSQRLYPRPHYYSYGGMAQSTIVLTSNSRAKLNKTWLASQLTEAIGGRPMVGTGLPTPSFIRSFAWIHLNKDYSIASRATHVT